MSGYPLLRPKTLLGRGLRVTRPRPATVEHDLTKSWYCPPSLAGHPRGGVTLGWVNYRAARCRGPSHATLADWQLSTYPQGIPPLPRNPLPVSRRLCYIPSELLGVGQNPIGVLAHFSSGARRCLLVTGCIFSSGSMARSRPRRSPAVRVIRPPRPTVCAERSPGVPCPRTWRSAQAASEPAHWAENPRELPIRDNLPAAARSRAVGPSARFDNSHHSATALSIAMSHLPGSQFLHLPRIAVPRRTIETFSSKAVRKTKPRSWLRYSPRPRRTTVAAYPERVLPKIERVAPMPRESRTKQRMLDQGRDHHLTIKITIPVFILLSWMFSEPIWTQDGRSVFSALDTQGRTVFIGELRTGALTESDLIDRDGSRIQVWSLSTSSQTESIQVDLESDEFDSLLYVVGPGLNKGLQDDDGGIGSNSRICFAPSQPGDYRVVVSSFGFGLGPFRLSISPAQQCETPDSTDDSLSFLRSLSTEGRYIEVSQEVQGALTDADQLLGDVFPVQAWAVQGEARQPFSVDLISHDFDPFLILIGPGLSEGFVTDDNGAGGCDARISIDLPTSHEYRLIVASTEIGAAGFFTLIAGEIPRPVSAESCRSFLAIDDDLSLDEISVVGELTVDETVTGVIPGDERTFRGSPLQGWTLTGTKGDQLIIELTSSLFDTYLFFDGPGFFEPLFDDDSGEETDSRICVHLPETGTYRVFAGAFDSSVEPDAQYRLRVFARDTTPSCPSFRVSLTTFADGAATIGVDDRRHGTLTRDTVHPDSNRPIDPWILRAPPGTKIVVDVVTDDFDAYLYALSDESGVLTADDFGDSTNSRMEIELPNSGEVLLLVSSYKDSSAGDYLLRVSRDPPPME